MEKLAVSRPREYLAFLKLPMRTHEGPAYVFAAVDAYTGYAFNLGVERDDKPETIEKQIDLLIEQAGFHDSESEGFTLIFDEDQEQADRIPEVIRRYGGKIIVDMDLHNTIALPFLQSLREFFDKEFES